MTRFSPVRRLLAALAALALALAPAAPRAQVAAPHAIELPAWFAHSFLDFREDIAEAAKERKRLRVYFGQDGCPYCAALMRANFTQPKIVEKTRKYFAAVALNIWGDREVTWLDGRAMPEKEFAKLLKVQFTPTLMFFDEQGNVVARLNGYYPPHRFEAALDYVADVIKLETTEPEDLGGAREGPDFQNLHRNKRSITLNHQVFADPQMEGAPRSRGRSAAPEARGAAPDQSAGEALAHAGATRGGGARRGAHTEELLREIGCDDAEIARLRQNKII